MTVTQTMTDVMTVTKTMTDVSDPRDFRAGILLIILNLDYDRARDGYCYCDGHSNNDRRPVHNPD